MTFWHLIERAAETKFIRVTSTNPSETSVTRRKPVSRSSMLSGKPGIRLSSRTTQEMMDTGRSMQTAPNKMGMLSPMVTWEFVENSKNMEGWDRPEADGDGSEMKPTVSRSSMLSGKPGIRLSSRTTQEMMDTGRSMQTAPNTMGMLSPMVTWFCEFLKSIIRDQRSVFLSVLLGIIYIICFGLAPSTTLPTILIPFTLWMAG
nr:uncharacterized protein LOC115137336 isoform X3 [Oncorhynchus nerka]